MGDAVGRDLFPPTQVAGRGRGWYRGDCHVHSVCSNGGELTPAQLVAGARAAGLDFLATTEHNGEAVVVADCDPAERDRVRAEMPLLASRRPEAYPEQVRV